MTNGISFELVSKHNTKKDLWVIIHGKVYDLTDFVNEHPGGSKVLLKVAGTDGSKEFEKFHPPDMMDRFLDKKYHLGLFDQSTMPAAVANAAELDKKPVPPLNSILNLYDFESVAKEVLSTGAWAYYSSGGENELTLQENQAVFRRIWLKPRVLVDVKSVDLGTTFLGTRTRLPFYISATALGKLGHPEGEVVLTKAAGTRKIIQMIPTLASCSIDELVEAKLPDQTQWFQLYVNPDRRLTAQIIERAIGLGVTAIFVTVDAPQLGRREKDMRVKFEDEAPDVSQGEQINRNEGVSRAISTFIDSALNWSDIPFFKKVINGRAKLVLKGIQAGEDAVLAAKAGVDAIVLSNHGGRQLDTCRSAIEVLVEVKEHLQKASLDGKMELYVDGGFRRGADIFKALALGATGVGLGRPFLYAMSAYGQKGVEHAIDILQDELEMVMRLMGVVKLKDIKPEHVLCENLHNRITYDHLSAAVYETVKPLRAKL